MGSAGAWHVFRGSRAAVLVAATVWLGSGPAVLAQAPPFDGPPSPLVNEVRLGLLAHSIEPSNAEDGVDLNLEVLFRRPAIAYGDVLLDWALRPRLHLGASLNMAGDTSQVYAGFSWDVRLTQRMSLELSFGGALHDGPTDGGHADSYGCPLNFRESLSLGYALGERWTVYGTVSHMSNANLCDRNSGLSDAGVRLGYKLN